MENLDTPTTLNDSAGSSAAGTQGGTETANQNTPAAGGDMTDVVSWKDALEWDTAGTDTPPGSADVAKDGAKTQDKNGATSQDEDSKKNDDAKVPWHNDPRWKAWQEEKALLDQAKPLIDPLLQQYGGIEGINAEIARQAQEAERAQAADLARQDEESVAQRLQQQVQRGELDEGNYQQALQYEVGLARLYRTEMNGAIQTAATSYPDMDRDLVAAFAADPDMVKVIAQHTHGRVASLRSEHAKALAAKDAEIKTAGERAVAEYVAANADRLKQPPAEGGGGTGPGGPIDRKNLGGWGSILGGRGRQA